MLDLERMRKALEYIDANKNQPITINKVAQVFHFSSCYFHRMFTSIVGKPLAAYIRERRLLNACKLLASTNNSITNICIECGFDTSQSFCRAFKRRYNVTPTRYRTMGYSPIDLTIDDIIASFAAKLIGGIFMQPKLIHRDKLIIAGKSGDGSETAELWQKFVTATQRHEMQNKYSDDGYEVRICSEDRCDCHVGYLVAGEEINDAFDLLVLPASEYAAFDVYVEQGYDSQNNAMDEWLEHNKDKYSQQKYNGKEYAIEYYDERFSGDQPGSIVEIWVSIEPKLLNS